MNRVDLLELEPLLEIPSGRPLLSVQELNRLMRQQGLVLAVAQAVILDEAVRAVSLSEEDERQLISAYLAAQGVPQAVDREAWLQQRGWIEEDLRYFASKGRRLELFRQRCFGDEVEVRFLDRKSELDQVVYSMVRVREEQVAEEIHHRLLEGEEDFPELAEMFSIGGERHTRGLIGPVPLAAGHPELFSRLRVSHPGQIWPPFHVVDIWVVMRFERLIPAQLNAAMREHLLNELFDEWMDARVAQLTAGEPLPPLPACCGESDETYQAGRNSIQTLHKAAQDG